MLFNSIDFAIYLPIVFILYWFATNDNLKLQNYLIVIASYTFYGWWDWRFLSLIFISTSIDYLVGWGLSKQKNATKRKGLLLISILFNLGILGFFKYYNFFLDNFVAAFDLLGQPISPQSLNIILPIGISFYTFQTMSYTIDVYKKKIEHTHDFIAFTAFVSFFPQLVAGPIEKASNLLPQFYKKRVFHYDIAVDGLRQILWGLFKKIVIADNCAEQANQVFNNSDEMNASALVLGAVFFSFQIYGDFSGYSCIAIGTSKLFGFNLKRNFAFPYFSRDIAEFWRKWHISLSTWFRDYLYIPLGGSKGSVFLQIRNMFIVFIVSGFWHGADWSFIFWGFLNAIYFLPLLLLNRNRKNITPLNVEIFLPSFRDFISIITTYALCVFAWIFFRAQSLHHAFNYISDIFDQSIIELPTNTSIKMAILLFILTVFMFVEWLHQDKEHGLQLNSDVSKLTRYLLYFGIATSILLLRGSTHNFIYFQF